jgi:uncharacterized membrane protein
MNEDRDESPFSLRSRLAIAGFSATIALFAILSPWPLQDKLYSIGHACCAQIPSHTIRFDGQPMPIDSRNSGIYTGVLMVVAIMWLTGRRTAAQFVPARIRNVLILCVLAMVLDGFNSLAQTHHFHTYYQPSNLVRIATGTLAGSSLAILTIPLFNRLVWHEPDPIAIAEDFTDLFGYLAGTVVIIITLQQAPPALYYPMSILSILGLLTTLTFVNACIVLVSLGRMNVVASKRAFIVPALFGLTAACFEIMAIDLWHAFHG